MIKIFLFFAIVILIGYYSEQKITKINIYLLDKYSDEVVRYGKGAKIKEVFRVQQKYSHDLFVLNETKVIINIIFFGRIGILLVFVLFLIFGY